MSATLSPTPGAGSPPPGASASPPPPGGAPATPAPIGSSTATGPSQNLGATAQGNQIAGAVLQMMTMALTKIPPGTPLFKAFSKALADIGKEIEPGAASPAGIGNAMKAAAMNQSRMAPHAAAQTTQAGGPGGAMPPKPAMAA